MNTYRICLTLFAMNVPLIKIIKLNQNWYLFVKFEKQLSTSQVRIHFFQESPQIKKTQKPSLKNHQSFKLARTLNPQPVGTRLLRYFKDTVYPKCTLRTRQQIKGTNDIHQVVSTHLKNVCQLGKGKSAPGKNHTLLKAAPKCRYYINI